MKSVTWALGAFALMAAAAQCVTWFAQDWLGNARDHSGDAQLRGVLVNVLDSARMQTVLLALGQMAMTLLWLRRAEANNAARGRPGTMTPGFVVMGFFIPLYRFLHRYLVVQKVWWCSATRGSSTVEGPLPFTVKMWGAWGMVTGVLGMVTQVMALTRRAEALQVNAALLAIEACVEAVLLVSVAVALEGRQRRAHESQNPVASVATLMGHVPDRG